MTTDRNAGESCRACRFFEDDPAAIERGLPGIASLSSAHGASRADDGLCIHHDRYVRASAYCPSHAPPISAGSPPPGPPPPGFPR